MMNGSLQMSSGYRAIHKNLDYEQYDDDELYGSSSPPYSPTSSSLEEDDEILSSPSSPPRSPSPPPIHICESDEDENEPHSQAFNIFSDYTSPSHNAFNFNTRPYYEVPTPQRPSLRRNDRNSSYHAWKLSLDKDKDENGQEDENKENWVEKEMLWRLVRKPRPLSSFYMRWVARQEKKYVGQQVRRERRMMARNRWRRKVLEGRKGWEMTKVEKRSKLGL